MALQTIDAATAVELIRSLNQSSKRPKKKRPIQKRGIPRL